MKYEAVATKSGWRILDVEMTAAAKGRRIFAQRDPLPTKELAEAFAADKNQARYAINGVRTDGPR